LVIDPVREMPLLAFDVARRRAFVAAAGLEELEGLVPGSKVTIVHTVCKAK